MRASRVKAGVLLIIFSFILTTLGAGPAPAAGPERSDKGFVKSVTKTEIVVTEYNKNKNAEVDVTYLITPDTQAEIYGDIPVSQVKVGDEIEIDYVASGKKKIAEFISVDLSSYE